MRTGPSNVDNLFGVERFSHDVMTNKLDFKQLEIGSNHCLPELNKSSFRPFFTPFRFMPHLQSYQKFPSSIVPHATIVSCVLYVFRHEPSGKRFVCTVLAKLGDPTSITLYCTYAYTTTTMHSRLHPVRAVTATLHTCSRTLSSTPCVLAPNIYVRWDTKADVAVFNEDKIRRVFAFQGFDTRVIIPLNNVKHEGVNSALVEIRESEIERCLRDTKFSVRREAWRGRWRTKH